MRIVLALEAREGPNTQDKAERLLAAIGHLFEDMMATHHPLGFAGKVAGKAPNTQHPVGLPTALEEIWCGTSPARPQQCVHDGERCGHIGILSSSVPSLSSPSV